MLSPPKQSPCRPHVSFSSTAFFYLFYSKPARFLHFYCSGRLVFWLCLPRRSDFSRANPNMRGPSDASLCELVCLWVCVNCVCVVCAGSYSRSMMMRVDLMLLSEPSLSKHSQLRSPIWQRRWAPLNCEPFFQLIGMLFWFTYPAWLITAEDNTHGIMLLAQGR